MREAGFTYKEIGAKSGESWSTVRSQLQKLGVQPQQKIFRERLRKPLHQFPRWLIHEMYCVCQLSTTQISYELDIPRSSVATIMLRMHIPFRSKKEAWRLYKLDPFYVRTYITTEQAIKAGQASGRSRRRRIRKRANKQRHLQKKRLRKEMQCTKCLEEERTSNAVVA